MFREEFEVALHALLRATKKVYGGRLVSLAVFGSVGRGTPRPDSDIDLLLVADDMPRGRMKRMAEFVRVEEEMKACLPQLNHISVDLSPVLKDRNEVLAGSLLFLDMIEDARILYDKGGFFTSFLCKQRERLAELGAHKHYRKGAWYWVLKKDYKPGEKVEI
ncbi:MAG: nucleotidyltransferase domain-containing protein [Syntrophothermus sp.]|uniref:nucleotidyltransferase family protein n=1 Tax=Syntrophothermus sp. TaxID=2736299 RepID=UPI00257D5EE5|nr:nucleotidyltransferase domain-containing protein [Syntrophothermus sp.]NSW83829.1 nucleotidyltransferase domain-containing protein [Syntrophothermus sp.]